MDGGPVFPSNVALLHAAKEALDDIGAFPRQQFHAPLLVGWEM
jgi:hypothetical protein